MITDTDKDKYIRDSTAVFIKNYDRDTVGV